MHVHFRELKSYPANRGGGKETHLLDLVHIDGERRLKLFVREKDKYVFKKKNLYD